jgi:hypothetical protein
MAPAVAVAGEFPPVNESNPELDSILGHSPLKENEGNWGHGGGFGYSIGQNSFGAPSNGRSREEWELHDTHSSPSAYQSQPRDYTGFPDNMTPMYNQDRNGANAQPPYLTPTQQTFIPPQQHWELPALPLQSSSADHRPTDRSPSPPPPQRQADISSSAPSSTRPPHAFSVTLADPGPTSTASVSSMKSVEMHGGHGIGRSFRASVEG